MKASNDRVEVAWLTANLSRRQRLPSLNSLLNSRSRRITDDEREFAEQIRAAEGYREIPPVHELPWMKGK